MTWTQESAERTITRLAQIRSGPPPAPELGRGLFYPAQLHTVFGEPGVGKSLLMAAIVAEAINAGTLVLWLDNEQGAPRVLRRLLAFGATDTALIESLIRVHFPHGFPQAKFHESLAGVELVVVDAFTGLLSACGLSSNSDTDVSLAYTTILRPFVELGAAVVVVDHVTKNRDTRGKYATGSQRKVGEPDVALAIEAAIPFRAGRGGRAKITIAKDRESAIRPMDFVIDAGMSWRLEQREADSGDGQWLPTALMARVSDYLEAARGPVSKATVERDVKGSAEYLRKAIEALIDQGYATTATGERRAILLTFAKAYQPPTSSTSSDLVGTSSKTRTSSTSSPRLPLQGGQDERDEDDGTPNAPPRLYDDEPDPEDFGATT